MWNLKNNTNESIQNRNGLTDLENKLNDYQRGEGIRKGQISMGLMDTNYIHKIDKQQGFTV